MYFFIRRSPLARPESPELIVKPVFSKACHLAMVNIRERFVGIVRLRSPSQDGLGGVILLGLLADSVMQRRAEDFL